MKVAVTDATFPDLAIEEAILGASDVRVVGGPCPSTDALIERVADADAVITQFAPVNAEVIAAMTRARAIVRYGIGVDNVDLEAARDRGIPVCNVPDYCIDEVADHALAFMLAATRQVAANDRHVRGGAWGLAVPLDRMVALRDLTVGLVGFGRIGREVAARLRPFKCRLLVHDPGVPDHQVEAAGATAVPLARLFETADVVSLHCPSNPGTRGMIDSAALRTLKPGAALVNVARGDLIDSEALLAALGSGQVGFAALDVFSPEPVPPGHPLLALPNVIVSSHVASASVTAVTKLRRTAARLALAAVRGEALANVVNGPVAAVPS